MFLFFISVNAYSQTGEFSFSVKSPSRSSAGVFKPDGTLVRTLWNSVHYPAGTFKSVWDGNDDLGNNLTSTNKNYVIKVLTNNVSYTWDGTIGNTSDSMTGNTKRQGYYACATGMAVTTSGRIYMCNGFSEGEASYYRTDTAHPNQIYNFYGSSPSRVLTLSTSFVATDDKLVYWGGSDSYANSNSMVHAIQVSDDANVTFPKGVNYNLAIGGSTFNAIGYVDSPNSYISGLAVQKNGNYLFIARKSLNQLQVVDKATGALVQTLNYSSPRGLSRDNNDNLWMITGANTVAKYKVNSDGTLSGSPLLFLTGIFSPASIDVSWDGTMTAVVDDSTQNVKTYDNSTGALVWTLGKPGGYKNDVTVQNDKFYTHDLRNTYKTFVVWQPDGTFWVNDPGNFRVQKFDKSRNFSNRIMSLASTYEVYVDPNNPAKVFAGLLEFSVDYNSPLTGTNGWSLTKNWGANVSSIYTSRPAFVFPTTLSNGRTYAILTRNDRPTNNKEFFDLSSTSLISTGLFRTNNWVLTADGSLQNFSKGILGGVSSVIRYPLTGFASNQPVWSATAEVLATTPSLTLNDPNDRITNNVLTASNKVIFWNPDAYYKTSAPAIAYTGYHLGAIKRNDNNWLWRTEKGTHINYRGGYPKPGWFDVGNSVHNNAGGTLSIFGNNLFTSYHGEFWKNSQTNKFNHYTDNGLSVGQFGFVKGDTNGNAPYGYAGNNLTPMVVADINDANSCYLYGGDESTHAGVHRWHITGLNTIDEQTVSITYLASLNPNTGKYMDLMAGLPLDDTLANNRNGWTRNYGEYVNSASDKFSVSTSRQSINLLSENDVTVEFQSNTVRTNYVDRDLGTNNIANDWKISGIVIFPAGNNENGSFVKRYLEVLDINKKVIATFHVDAITSVLTNIVANNVVLASAQDNFTLQKYGQSPQDFSIEVVAGVITFKYGAYTSKAAIADVSAKWDTPKTLRLKFLRNSMFNPARFQSMSVKDFKFYKDQLIQAVNQPPLAYAGSDQTIILPVSNTVLNGNGSDTDGTVVAYSWAKISGPSQGYIVNPSKDTTPVNSLLQGIYQYELTVTDDKGAIGKDTVQITIQTPLNIAPIANAGLDETITLPVNGITLSGTGADSDGLITSVIWKQISGPSIALIASPDAGSTSVNNLIQGLYFFEFAVTDNRGAIGLDTVMITVNPAINLLPVTFGGTDQQLILPVNNTSLAGSATDPDGLITNVLWIQLAGPALANIANPSSLTTGITNLIAGIYQFELSAIDNAGATTSDVVEIQVNNAANIPPVANAGSDITIKLPTDSLMLSGIATDSDGTITLYEWSQISGPNGALILSPDSNATLIKSMLAGNYKFQFKITDDDGAIAYDTVQVTVLNALNQPPVALAGSDINITLPLNKTTLSGNGTDVDGNIIGYQWSQVAGPNQAFIANPLSATTSIDSLVAGIYQFVLSVTDDSLTIANDTLIVTVGAAVNIAPFADAGPDQSLTLPVNNTILTGSGKDINGYIKAYQWIQIVGPNQANFLSPTSDTTVLTNLVQGTYNFILSVTDDEGAIAKDTVIIVVQVAINQVPVAKAGADQKITLPVNSVNLNGVGFDPDGTVVSYQWLQISGPSSGNIVSPGSSSTIINNLIQGLYEYQLTVTDDLGAVGLDTVQVTVNDALNQAPVANAGSNILITLPLNAVVLNGIGTDADGVITSYAWAQISGPAPAGIVYPNAANTIVNNLVQGIYKFELTVTDDDGAIAKQTVQVTVNPAPNIPPVVNAGVDITITLPLNIVSINGVAIDADGTITSHLWSKISGPAGAFITTPNHPSTSIGGLVQGIYTYQLTVTDNAGAIASDTIKIIVNAAINIPPVANAGTDKTITLPVNATTLTGKGTDADGIVVSYRWVKISGPANGVIVSPNSASTALTSLSQGFYKYEVTVTDNSGAKAKDTVLVTVNAAINIPPTANAGSDKVITLPVNSATLIGTGADADGTIASYKWSKISGSASALIVSANSATTLVRNLTQGVYVFQVTVTDNSGAIATDNVKIIVNPAVNVAPTANAGQDILITLPINAVSLAGKGTDGDGKIVSYNWSKISGPTAGIITSPSTANTAVTNLKQGIFEYQLTVTDDKGAVDKDTIKVTVKPAPNILPVANAGTDQVITLPKSSATLSGNATDADGTIKTYYWSKIAGPSAGTIASPDAKVTALNGLVQGVYKYELLVTDNSGGTAKDTIQITVNAAINLPPVANAGADKTITLPVNNSTLNGSGFDPDGTISKYSWIKISGPAADQVSSPASAITSVYNLTVGIYLYQLTVTDNKGATAKDTVKITVNPKVNLPPVAVAGKDIDLVLPDNKTSLTGAGTDVDGTIISYSWKVISGPAGYNIKNPSQALAGIENLFQGVYELEFTVKDNDGGIGRDTMKITVAAPRLSNVPADEVKIYPNPVLDIANISINTINQNTKVSVSIINVLGMIVKFDEFVTTSNTTLYPLNMSTLNESYYFINVKFDGGKSVTYKILKSLR